MRSRHIDVLIDLDRVRASAEAIRRRTRVALVAVIKADAYGLGAARMADALAPVADDFAYFSIYEAREVGKPGLVLGPPEGDPAEYRELGLRPTVCCLRDAQRFADLPVAVSVDSGMQRFGCDPAQLDEILAACRATELITHAARPEAAELLARLGRGRDLRRHAASTSLLDCPAAWLDAVRPGLALYRGAMRVTTRLVHVRATHGPAGYSGFEYPYVGLILAGYSNHLAPAPVRINGRWQQLIEVGMNSSFVTVDPQDRVGDEVLLLGDELNEARLAAHLGVREHEVLCRYSAMGVRRYLSGTRFEVESAGDTTRSCAPAPQRT
jgi:alanine racemase